MIYTIPRLRTYGIAYNLGINLCSIKYIKCIEYFGYTYRVI